MTTNGSTINEPLSGTAANEAVEFLERIRQARRTADDLEAEFVHKFGKEVGVGMLALLSKPGSVATVTPAAPSGPSVQQVSGAAGAAPKVDKAPAGLPTRITRFLEKNKGKEFDMKTIAEALGEEPTQYHRSTLYALVKKDKIAKGSAAGKFRAK